MRPGGRDHNQMREVRIDLDYTKHADGSVHIAVGDTRVLCTCSVEDKVPPFLNHMNQGWITAEYGMLPEPRPLDGAGSGAGQTVRTDR